MKEEGSNQTKIGLIAGSGKFPVIFAWAAKKRGSPVVALAVEGETSPELEDCVAKIHWIGIKELGRALSILKDEGITKAIMAGHLSPTVLFENKITSDEEVKDILESAKDKRADSLLGVIAKRLKIAGIDLIDSTTYLSDLMAQKGTLTRRKPTQAQWEDVRFGASIAQKIAALDIGQTVVVKDKAILAIEAIEGTDEAIRRGGDLGRGDVVVVKVSKPQQDMRFDVPVVGPETVKSLREAKAAVLAIESKKTLVIDEEEVIKLADSLDISVVVI